MRFLFSTCFVLFLAMGLGCDPGNESEVVVDPNEAEKYNVPEGAEQEFMQEATKNAR